VRLTELISGLICPDRYELLELAFMGDFRSIFKEVLRTICLKLYGLGRITCDQTGIDVKNRWCAQIWSSGLIEQLIYNV